MAILYYLYHHRHHSKFLITMSGEGDKRKEITVDRDDVKSNHKDITGDRPMNHRCRPQHHHHLRRLHSPKKDDKNQKKRKICSLKGRTKNNFNNNDATQRLKKTHQKTVLSAVSGFAPASVAAASLRDRRIKKTQKKSQASPPRPPTTFFRAAAAAEAAAAVTAVAASTARVTSPPTVHSKDNTEGGEVTVAAIGNTTTTTIDDATPVVHTQSIREIVLQKLHAEFQGTSETSEYKGLLPEATSYISGKGKLVDSITDIVSEKINKPLQTLAHRMPHLVEKFNDFCKTLENKSDTNLTIALLEGDTGGGESADFIEECRKIVRGLVLECTSIVNNVKLWAPDTFLFSSISALFLNRNVKIKYCKRLFMLMIAFAGENFANLFAENEDLVDDLCEKHIVD